MSHATTEGTERCPDFGRYAPLYAVPYTLRAKMPVPARLRVRFHSPRSGLPRKVTLIMKDTGDIIGHLSGSSMGAKGASLALIAFLYKHAGCALIESRLGESSGLLVPAMQRDTDLRHDGIEDVDGARITQDGVAYSTDRTHDPLE